MSNRPLLKSFNWAIEGIVYAVRTQRNMRIHLVAGVIVLVVALVLGVSRTEFLVLLFTVAMVLVAELINTAIEATIDLIATTYDPLAKIAKDVAAAAVLVSSIAAIFVGYLIFFEKISPYTRLGIGRVLAAPVHVTLLALLATTAIVIATKAFFGHHEVLRGGMPSGHVAAATALMTAITLLSHNALIATFALMIVILVAQSRIEAGFHTLYQAIAGAAVGLLITVLVFQLLRIG